MTSIPMPRIDLGYLHEKLPSADYVILRRTVDQLSWKLRRTRPKIMNSDIESRYAAYVWRMIAFYVSPIREHHCMPVGAFYYLPKEADKELITWLDTVVDAATDTIPPQQWYGVLRWRGLYSPGLGANEAKDLAEHRSLK